MNEQKNDEEETILEKIKSNYYYQNNVIYYFYEPIFDYIVGLNILDENLLEKDIKKNIKSLKTIRFQNAISLTIESIQMKCLV